MSDFTLVEAHNDERGYPVENFGQEYPQNNTISLQVNATYLNWIGEPNFNFSTGSFFRGLILLP